MSYYASDNTVKIENGTIDTFVAGAYIVGNNASDRKISNNSVIIESGDFTSSQSNFIAGAYSVHDDGQNKVYENNSVTINGGSFKEKTCGANIYGAASHGSGSTLNNNRVVITGGDIRASFVGEFDYGGGIYGAFADGKESSASGNSVTISGGNVKGDIFGAYVWGNSNSQIANNVVYLKGGTIEGTISAIRLRNLNGNAHDNGIVVDGSGDTLDLDKAVLKGCYSETINENCTNQYLQMDNYKGNVQSVLAFDKVSINNSDVVVKKVDLHMYQEWDDVFGDFDAGNSSLAVTKMVGVNKFSLENSSADVSELEDVYNIDINNSSVNFGKVSVFDKINIVNQNSASKELNLGELHGYVDSITGESYGIISTDSQFKAVSIDGLNQLNINMDHIAWKKDQVIVDVEGKADFYGTAVNVDGDFGASADTVLNNGDRMSLIKSGELIGITADLMNDTKILQGFAKEVEVDLVDGDNSIDFVISGDTTASDQTVIIGGGRAAALAFANQGSDILNEAFNGFDDGKYGIKTFAVVHGNRSEYDVGNDIKVNGWSVLTGVGEKHKLDNGDFSWGIFYENGSGNYRTYNDFNNVHLTGYGSSVYNGGGVLARYDDNNGIYTEVGARMGTLKNSLQGAVVDGLGEVGGYDARTDYYGAHLGVGKLIAFGNNESIDIYGKYFYVHHEDEQLDILGDEVHFGSMDSNRLRIGARYNKYVEENMLGYFGLAWDHEFDGDANVTAAGFDVDDAALQGDAAVIELGLKVTPKNSPWDFDLGVQGYTGVRTGFSGNIQANYTF